MLLLLTIGLFITGCSSKPSYVVTAPNVFYVGVPQPVHVALFDVRSPHAVELELHASVSYGKTKVIASQRDRISADRAKLFPLTVGPEVSKFQSSQDRRFVYLLVRIKGPVFHISKNIKVNVSYSDGIILIQTDKPIYTPKQTVKIRVVPLGFDLMPSTKEIKLIVKNPHGIGVRQWENLNTASGFFSKNIDIGSYALAGNWTIEAHYGHQFLHNTSSRFEVREYVLPRFSVKISSVQYILPTLDSFEITGTAKYTYGKPVQGTANVRLSFSGNSQEKAISLSTSRLKLVNGGFRYPIKMDKIKAKLRSKWFPEGYRLHIKTDVTEKSTGKTERAMDNSIYFVTTPYRIEYINTARYFKPGLPFTITVRVKYTNGHVAQRIPMRLVVEAFRNDGEKTNASNLNSNEMQGGGANWNRANTDEKGEAEFVINIARQVKRLQIKVKTSLQGIPKEQNAVKDLLTSASESSELMKLRQATKPAMVGTNAVCDAVINSKTVDQLTYLVISRGQVVYTATIKKLLGIITTISFKVTPSMSPSARLFAFYVSKETGKLVSDSILLDVEDKFPNPIYLKDSEKRHEEPPSMGYSIKILGTMRTNVGLLGIDQSVYLLNKKNILTAESVFKKQEDLDLGCGAGSGRNSEDMFKNAGLVVLSSDIEVSGNQKCEEDHRRERRSIEEDSDYCCRLGNKTDPIKRSCYRRIKDLDVSVLNAQQRYSCRETFYMCCMHKFGKNESSIFTRGRSGPEGILNFGDEQEDEDEILSKNTRQYFPETWINQELTISQNERSEECTSFLSQELLHQCGSVAFPVSLPDTMTTWVVQAIGVSNTTGFGIANPLYITTFKPFFIYLSLPYFVKRGEEITILATLFNYKKYDVSIHLFLRGDQGFCSAAGKPGKMTKLTTSRINVPSQETISFPITIVPIKYGEIPIEVIAYGDLGDDRVLKKLNVVPEGIEERLTQSYVLDPQELMKGRQERQENQERKPEKLSFQSTQAHGNSKQTNKIKLELPKNAIPRSISARIYFTGNMIGQALTNLAAGEMTPLLQLPDGCGEQNMVRIAPNVYILHYLTQTNQMNPEVEKKKEKFIQEGYIHELNYRKTDGSFALFKKEHIKGSTWLTAFVLKVFCQASKLRGVNIERNDLCQSAKWLIGNQRDDGAFVEHANMGTIQGGVYTSDVTLTAAVVIALKQCQCGMSDVNSGVQRAVGFLERNVSTLADAYSLAITTYALVLAESPERFRANQRLIQLATYNPGTSSRYWETGSKARNIETAGYALLAQVAMDRFEYAGPIVVWLTKQRSFGGGFISTADTCIALESIAKYSEQSQKFQLDLRIKMKNKIMRITRDNAFLQQEADLTERTGEEVDIETSGSGIGQMQVDIKYNVPSKEDKRCDFDLTVTATEEGSGLVISSSSSTRNNVRARPRPKRAAKRKSRKSKRRRNRNNVKKRKHRKNRKANRRKSRKRIKEKRTKKNKRKPQGTEIPKKIVLTVCAKYRKSGQTTGMAIIDVGIVTGFSADEDSLIKLVEKRNNGIERYELSDRSVVFYMRKIGSDKRTCVAIHLLRAFDVGIIQPVPVNVYDYYEPDIKCTLLYNLRSKRTSAGSCNGNRCRCTQGMCAESDPSIGNMDDLLNEVCNVYNYAFSGKVVAIDEKRQQEGRSMFLTYQINVNKIVKKGNSQFQPKMAYWFTKPALCQYPDLQLGEEVFIMGKHKNGVQFLDRETFVKTLNRRHRFVNRLAKHVRQGNCD